MQTLKRFKRLTSSIKSQRSGLLYKCGGFPLSVFDNLDAAHGQTWLPLLFSDQSQTGEVYLASLYKRVLADIVSQDQLDILTSVFSKKIISKVDEQRKENVQKQYKLLNQQSSTECKLFESKFILGIGNKREDWQSNMVKLAYFSNYRLGIYYAGTKIMNSTRIPCLLQTQIVYKSTLKIAQNDPNLLNNPNGISQKQEVHLVQFETEGQFDPQQVSLDEEFSKVKSAYSWFDSSANRELFCERMKKVMGIKDGTAKIKWQVSDIDNSLEGNHPKIFPPHDSKFDLF